MGLAKVRIGALLSFLAMVMGSPADATEPLRHGVVLSGEVKYPVGFPHFDYVDPQAPKGGDLKLAATGTFDTFNPILEKGGAAPGLGLVFDTLMKDAEDEVSASYGLLAEGVSYPQDVSSATFRLRAEARWAYGKPVTPEDVIFSFEKSKELNPLYMSYYRHVVAVEKTGERDVTFRFDETNNHELPMILGQFQILPRHWWEGTGPDGKPRDINRTTLEPVMGSGPYRIADFKAGATIRYELRDDYWGTDLNVNVGQNNFTTISYTMFGDLDVQFEAFRSGNFDYWMETKAARWATSYDFPAVKDGRVKREELPNPYRATGIMQALVPNMRRDIFKDQRVREALNYALDFEEMNRTVFYGAYKRVDSYFFGTELASRGLPEGRELEILNEIRDKVPAGVFTESYSNPVGGSPQAQRENLRKAVGLLKDAGYEIKGGRMVNTATGAPLSFEILLSNPMLEVVAVPYSEVLRKIGIEARVRTVDDAQYANRARSFDYDMTWVVWGQTLNPGNEQRDLWGSVSKDRPGSRNYAGIADPGIDALIDKVIFAKGRDDLVAATRALDRVLLAHDYVVPLYYGSTARIAYWDKFDHPAELPTYSIGFPTVWWSKSAAR